jgi:hypothetical protein
VSEGGALRKPTAASVTDMPCRCGSLERDARDSNLPIRFDPQCNEYYFEFTLPKGTKLSLVIYHCPMCGGVASESKRDSAFVALSKEEALRVGALVRDLETMDEIVSKLGPPDRDTTSELPDDIPASLRTIPGTDLQQVGPLRALTYENLSETAEVQFTIYSNGKTSKLISPKYIDMPTAADGQ